MLLTMSNNGHVPDIGRPVHERPNLLFYQSMLCVLAKGQIELYLFDGEAIRAQILAISFYRSYSSQVSLCI